MVVVAVPTWREVRRSGIVKGGVKVDRAGSR